MYDREKDNIDQQAEREGQAMTRALQPKYSSQNSTRMRLQAEHNKDKFDKLFKD